MAITSLQTVENRRNSRVLFINAENSGNNREIPPNRSRGVGNCWIPWCTNARDFPAHHIQIIDMDSDTVLAFIWQRNSKDGDFVRVSNTGFEDPGRRIDGQSDVGKSYDLIVTMAGVETEDAP